VLIYAIKSYLTVHFGSSEQKSVITVAASLWAKLQTWPTSQA